MTRRKLQLPLLLLAGGAAFTAWILSRPDVVGGIAETFDDGPVWNPLDMSQPSDSPIVYGPLDPLARRSAVFWVPSLDVQDFIRSWESYSATPYDLKDGGITFGYGHQEPYGSPNIPQYISEPDARALFEADLFGERGAERVWDSITIPINQYEFDALVSAAYNLTLRSWRSMANAVNNGADVPSLFSQYVYATINGVKKQLRGLVRRRSAESAIWIAGDYSGTA